MYENENDIDNKTRDLSRARQSLVEELQAIMWYDERVSATKDKSLALVLAHNRDDEKEHATLLLEWLRRHDPKLHKELKEILFSKKELKEIWD
ncbi:MAG: ferritin [Candidatus Micrarchaeia archaeon]